MNKKNALLAIPLLLVIGLSNATAQKIVPEEVKKKCPETPLQQRVRLAVARFTQSSSGINSSNVDNFSSMLSNAMFEVECFRMLSMQKDSNDNKDAEEESTIKPQLVITGEITEYSHKVKEKTNPLSKKVTTIAHIGFILQVKDPVTRDVLFSKSFNEEGSSENKSLVVKLPKIGGGVGSTSSESVDKAYADALEKGILKAVEYVVDSRDKIYDIVKNTSDPGGNKTTILVQNANFMKLMEIEKALKASSSVTKVDKTLKDDSGKILVYHSNKVDDLVAILTEKSSLLDITGLDGSKITVKIK